MPVARRLIADCTGWAGGFISHVITDLNKLFKNVNIELTKISKWTKLDKLILNIKRLNLLYLKIKINE